MHRNLSTHVSPLRADTRRLLGSWMLGHVWLFTITGAALNKFARELGTPDDGFGILAAMPYLGTLLQLPASYLIDGRGVRRRILFIIVMTISRMSWVVMAIIPWLTPPEMQAQWLVLAAMMFVAWSAHNMGAVAWTSWMADLVPSRIRGRLFGTCARYTQPVVLIAALSVGYVIDVAEVVQATRPGIMLQVTIALLALGGLIGTLGVGPYRRIREPERTNAHDIPWLHSLRKPLRDRNFRRYVGMNFTLTLAFGFMGQYIWLYMFDVGLMKAWVANMILVVLPRFVHMYSYGVWGHPIDKLGCKPVIITAIVLMGVSPIGWFMVGQPDATIRWSGFAIAMLGIFAWPGFEIGGLNMILAISRDREEGGSACVVINSIVTAVAGVLSGLLSFFIVGRLQHLDMILPLWDMRFTYHAVLLALSMCLRWATLPWALSLHEPTAGRAALHEHQRILQRPPGADDAHARRRPRRPLDLAIE